MSDELTIAISIPSDDDGYILLQCPHCTSFFKATATDIEDEGILELYCPSCGLSDTNFLTEDVVKLANTKAQNFANNVVNKYLKKMEKEFKNSPMKFNIKDSSKNEYESPITSGIDTLEIVSFPCCVRSAKIKPLLKITGCYCPFCGVKNYEIE